jgi:flavin-dependent dehydrogenase
VSAFDVAVVGAGSAGSTAAYRSSRAGARVLLDDKAGFPRDKPCGGGVTARAARLLPFSLEPVVEDRIERLECRLRYGRSRFVRTASELRGYRLPLRRPDSRLARGSAAVIGDAAGLVDPFSGDGMYEAFLSSKLVTEAALDVLAGRAAGLEPYEQAVARRITPLTAAGWGAKVAFERFPRTTFALASLPVTFRALEQLLLGELGEPAAARGLKKAAILLLYGVARRAGDPGRAYHTAPV